MRVGSCCGVMSALCVHCYTTWQPDILGWGGLDAMTSLWREVPCSIAAAVKDSGVVSVRGWHPEEWGTVGVFERKSTVNFAGGGGGSLMFEMHGWMGQMKGWMDGCKSEWWRLVEVVDSEVGHRWWLSVDTSKWNSGGKKKKSTRHLPLTDLEGPACHPSLFQHTFFTILSNFSPSSSHFTCSRITKTRHKKSLYCTKKMSTQDIVQMGYNCNLPPLQSSG